MTTPAETCTKFEDWVAERERLGDQINWLGRDGGLNKTKIYKACGLSGYQPFNTYLKTRFDQVEREWVKAGITSAPKTARKGAGAVLGASNAAADRRREKELEDAQARIKHLEERNATLQAELVQLRSKYRRIDEHLGLTGRLLPR